MTPAFRPLAPFALVAALSLGCGDDSDSPAAMSGDGAAGSTGSADSSTSSEGTGGSADDGGIGSGGRADASTTASSDAGGNTGGGSDASTGANDAGSNVGELPRFSFFVTSLESIVKLAQSSDGFGGDLRYGETGDGAGLRGADKICAAIAEASMPGAGAKQWRAFLSASTGGANGGALHARDRIGSGPWYDRQARLVASGLDDLLGGIRPTQADTAIRNDLPNETGTPNHNPGTGTVDNHDTLTGSDGNGRYVSGANTCSDWTSVANTSSGGGGGGGGGGSGPAVGHSWPRNGDTSSAGNGHWVVAHRAGGCAKGINVAGQTNSGTTVGSGGGYGGFYCFALMP
jgi:hypothetical protein